MLIAADVITELSTANDQSRSLNFVKKVMKGLLYIEASGSGPVAGQVRTGDGVAKAAALDVTVRAHGAAVVAVTVGSAKFGGGTAQCWLRTTSGGVFAVSVTGTGDVLLELTVSGGVPTFVVLSL